MDAAAAADKPGMTLSSPAFKDGAAIPTKFTGDGDDVSPALQWQNAPAETVEFALIVDDPDAPTPQPWVHWLIYKLPGSLRGVPEGAPRTARLNDPQGALQGVNSWTTDNVGYRGPAPPKGHGVHHYHFKLYALSAPIAAGPGVDKATLLAAMSGKVLAECELVGTYER